MFNDAMTAASARFAASVVRCYDFGRFRTVVDVGGGQGALVAAVLEANPAVHGLLYDLPQVIADAGGPLREAGVDDRCERVGGDFFESVPSGGDAYLLSNIVHDWDDDRAVRILANCRAAMTDDGRVLLAEAVLPGGPEPHPAKWVDLEMLVMGGGRQRTAADFSRLFGRAGLRLSRVVPGEHALDLVEAVPAGASVVQITGARSAGVRHAREEACVVSVSHGAWWSKNSRQRRFRRCRKRV